eukprot:5922458-Pyramimonas_sp.AAC.1
MEARRRAAMGARPVLATGSTRKELGPYIVSSAAVSKGNRSLAVATRNWPRAWAKCVVRAMTVWHYSQRRRR